MPSDHGPAALLAGDAARNSAKVSSDDGDDDEPSGDGISSHSSLRAPHVPLVNDDSDSMTTSAVRVVFAAIATSLCLIAVLAAVFCIVSLFGGVTSFSSLAALVHS